MLGLRCCAWGFSDCGVWLLTAVPSLAEHELQGVWASVVVVLRLSGPEACGISRLGSEPVFPAMAGRFLTPETPGKSILQNCEGNSQLQLSFQC